MRTAAWIRWLVLGAACAASPVQATPACRAQASVDPPRAVVGEQVLYRVRIFSRDDVDAVEWSHPPAFPSVRTETLPGDPQPAQAESPAGFRVRDERRALFAERPGEHRLEAPALRCVLRGGVVEKLSVPVLVLPVTPPPKAGRAADDAGLVGPLALHVTVTPRELTLGQSLRVAVMLRGAGNLWSVASPFTQDAFPGSELFPRRPELVLERGRTLSLRRHFAYDVVPRSEGAVAVPALALAYFDPGVGRHRVARSEPVRVPVRASAEVVRGAGPPGEVRPGRRAGGDAHETQGIRWPLWLAGALGLAAAVVLFRRRRASPPDPVRAALRQASLPLADEDPEAQAAVLTRALRAALARHVDDAAAVTPEELIARRPSNAAVAAAAHLLASLERARFDPEAPPADPAAVRRAISDL